MDEKIRLISSIIKKAPKGAFFYFHYFYEINAEY
tara:strand:- start:757 stop:858 length:102 start_codon:yes stop_codon:yes gene_type:complete